MSAELTTTAPAVSQTDLAIKHTDAPDTAGALTERVEALRLDTGTSLDPARRGELGQFMTPRPVAQLMASMFEDLSGDLHVLDAGAGVGSLTAALTEAACRRARRPQSITAHAYEKDSLLAGALDQTLQLCKTVCAEQGIGFTAHVTQDDFITEAVSLLQGNLFSQRIQPRFNRAILNPPYYKINAQSNTRAQLRSVGIETVNLYAAFVALAILLLDDGGELVAITPRSFCNGPYFKPFRRLLFEQMTLKRVHLFDSRNRAFKGDQVLQENVIIHAVKTHTQDAVQVSTSTCAEDPNVIERRVPQAQIVTPGDPELFVHIATSEAMGQVAERARSLPCSLGELGVQVSTGRVVDFRARPFLHEEPAAGTAPLIYPCHFKQGWIDWPRQDGRKPQALTDCEETADLMVPEGVYVLVKRFSSKEERRRVVAAVYDPKRIESARVGFENHLNYFHIHGAGLTMGLAKGLALFLNSTLVDQYFRQFNGHTQVNATDLRSLRFPTRAQLTRLGKRWRTRLPEQARIDEIIEQTLFTPAR